MNQIISNAPVFLLLFGRVFALLMTLPLFSMRSVSGVAKVALAGYMAFFSLGNIDLTQYSYMVSADGVASLHFVLLLVGEVLIGIIMGLYVSIIFAAFSSAGQFIGFQMGLSIASSYDVSSQVENPLMGQFFNLVAMLVFLQTKWFQELFLNGLTSSFKAISAVDFALYQESFVKFLLRGLTNLFADAMIIAMPIMGSLFLITICTGLLGKAAPQMNLLSEGFPVMIIVGYIIIIFFIPNLVDFFVRSFKSGFAEMQQLFTSVSGGIK